MQPRCRFGFGHQRLGADGTSAKRVFPPSPWELTYRAPKAQVPNEAWGAQVVYSLVLGSTSLGLGALWSTLEHHVPI